MSSISRNAGWSVAAEMVEVPVPVSRSRVRPGDVSFLDDLQVNLAAAREVGIRAVLFPEHGPGDRRSRGLPSGYGRVSVIAGSRRDHWE
jgi:hypothetical protein